MNRFLRTSLIAVRLSALISVIPQSVHAQDFRGGSLGGYGGSALGQGSGMGMTSGPVIPYGGSFGGFMPFRMGGGGTLSYQQRGVSAMDRPRPSFSLSPMSSGMSTMSGSRSTPLLGMPGGGTLGGSSEVGEMGGMNGTAGTTRSRIMPPNFGYPFRQPPSLLSPTSPGLGMSM